MPLTDAQIERFARQIIIPEVGATGQQALCDATVAVEGTGLGAAIAAEYLRAAGVHVLEEQAPPPPNGDPADSSVLTCLLATTERGQHDAGFEWLESAPAPGTPIVWFSLRENELQTGISLTRDKMGPEEASEALSERAVEAPSETAAARKAPGSKQLRGQEDSVDGETPALIAAAGCDAAARVCAIITGIAVTQATRIHKLRVSRKEKETPN